MSLFHFIKTKNHLCSLECIFQIPFSELISTRVWGGAMVTKMLTSISGDSNASRRKTALGQMLPFRASPGPFPHSHLTSPLGRRGSYKVTSCLWGWRVEFPWKKQRGEWPPSCGKLLTCLSCNPNCFLFGGSTSLTSSSLRNQTGALGWKTLMRVLGHFCSR